MARMDVFEVFGADHTRNNYAAARLQGLEEDLGLKGDQYQTGKPRVPPLSVSASHRISRPFDPLRVLYSGSSAIQPPTQPPRSPFLVFGHLRDRLGTGLCFDLPGQELRRNHGLSVDVGLCGGPILLRYASLLGLTTWQNKC